MAMMHFHLEGDGGRRETRRGGGKKFKKAELGSKFARSFIKSCPSGGGGSGGESFALSSSGLSFRRSFASQMSS